MGGNIKIAFSFLFLTALGLIFLGQNASACTGKCLKVSLEYGNYHPYDDYYYDSYYHGYYNYYDYYGYYYPSVYYYPVYYAPYYYSYPVYVYSAPYPYYNYYWNYYFNDPPAKNTDESDSFSKYHPFNKAEYNEDYYWN